MFFDVCVFFSFLIIHTYIFGLKGAEHKSLEDARYLKWPAWQCVLYLGPSIRKADFPKIIIIALCIFLYM